MFVSKKSGKECRYRSGWELAYFRWLEINTTVVTYEYEQLMIPYVSNAKTGKIRKYYPDFLVKYADGHEELVEIKPSNRLSQRKIQKKMLAAEEWSRNHDVTFVVLTERELKAMGLI